MNVIEVKGLAKAFKIKQKEKGLKGKARIIDDDTTKVSTNGGDDKYLDSDTFGQGGVHRQFSGDELNNGKAKQITDDTSKEGAHRVEDSLEDEIIDLTEDDTTKDGARRISDLDSTLKAIMEARKSGDLNLYYTNVLKFAQGKTLNKGWGAKVSGLMSSYLVGDDISEGKAK